MLSRGKPVFYGWWIAIAAAIGLGLGGPPILVFSFPIFLKALTKEFHAGRSVIALAFSLHNVFAAFVSPVGGKIIDRFGIRKVVLPGTVLFAALMVGNRFVNVSVAGIYLFNILAALLMVSCGPIPYSTLVSKWFDVHRGAALAVTMAGLGISAVLMPSIVQFIITAASWRAAYALYGIAMLLIALPVLWFLLKDSPAELGLLPDGASSLSSTQDSKTLVGLSPREARRTSTFWMMIGAVVLLGASVHGCVMHLAAMITDKGIAPQTAALVSSAAGVGVLAGRVGTGFLLDRFFGPRLAICFSTSALVGITLLLGTHASGLTFLAAFLTGLGMGSEGDVIAYLTSRYFGLLAFGEIFGFTFGSFILSGACGAFLMGLGFDRLGSYTLPMLGCLAATSVAIVLFSRLGPYRYLPLEAREETVRHRQAASAAR